MLVVDDAKNVADQLKDLLNADIKVKIFTDSRPRHWEAQVKLQRKD